MAWTGSCERFPLICVFRMLWVNPRPDVPVKAVRFSNPAKIACPILMGLTAVVKQGKADAEAIAVSQAKAKEFLTKGIAAADAGKDAEAKEAFLLALKECPQYDG